MRRPTALRESLALCRAVGETDILLWAVEGLAALALDQRRCREGSASARSDDSAES